MTTESDLRGMSQTLQQTFAMTRRMIKENELQMASEELEFACHSLDKYVERIKKLDGAKIGLAGKIFRHPYRVPEEFMKVAIAMDKEAKSLTAMLEKKRQIAASQAGRKKAQVEKEQN